MNLGQCEKGVVESVKWPYWYPKLILRELNLFLMQKLTFSFVRINLYSCWPIGVWKRFTW